MPVYEYECKQCGNEFEVVLSVEEHGKKDEKKEIECPKCHSKDVHHEVEPVYVTTPRKS